MPTIHGWLTSTLLPPMSSRARRPMMLHERGILHSTRVRRRLPTSRCFVMRSGTTAVASDRLNPCIGCRHGRRVLATHNRCGAIERFSGAPQSSLRSAACVDCCIQSDASANLCKTVADSLRHARHIYPLYRVVPSAKILHDIVRLSRTPGTRIIVAKRCVGVEDGINNEPLGFSAVLA
jgi:hypothetical protein